jgi:hypothetical protein
MKRNVTTQYFLYTIINGVKFTYHSSSEKERIFKSYSEYCENFPKSKFEVVRQTTITETETIASSEDPRQSVFNL